MNSIIITKESLKDDDMIKLINDNFTDTDIKLFEFSFKYYIENKDNLNLFLIDLDDVYKFIGFTRKDHAKRLLNSKSFKENQDYIIKRLPRSGETTGNKKEQILFNITCFKKFCLKADTQESDKISDYFIKIEYIVFKYMEIKHNKQLEENKKIIDEKEQLLQIKDDENKKIINEKEQILQIKDNILEENKKIIEEKDKIIKDKDEVINNIKQLKYEDAEKVGSIYLLTTDKANITKCGRTKSISKRKTALQTAQVEDIEVLYEYKTSDDVLLELIVHKILSRYRLNREHFMCNIEYMKLIISTAGNVLDILNSSFEYITKEEILKEIYDRLELNKTEDNNTIEENKTIEENNIIEKNNNTIEDKDDTYKKIVKKKTTKYLKFSDLSEDIMSWFKENHILTKNNDDVIKIKDLYTELRNSKIFEDMSKAEKAKYNKTFFVNYIESNNFLKPYYCERTANFRTYLKCWIKTYNGSAYDENI